MNRAPWMPVALYTVLAFGLAWLVALPLWLGDGLASPWAGVLLSVMMLTPTVAAVITMFATRTPATARLRYLGMWPLRPAKRLITMLVIALVAPALIVAAVVFVSAALGLVRLDLQNFSGVAQALQAALPAGVPLPPVETLVIAQLAALPLGAVINAVPAAGEEIGWRGWLLPALLRWGTWPALVISGVLWGLWHAPVILLGYNFARPDLTGVLLMVGGCVAWGILFGWMRLRSASVWPVALAHGSLNAAAGLVVLLAAAGDTPDMGLVGPLGIVSWAVLAVVIVVLVAAGQFRRIPGFDPGRGV